MSRNLSSAASVRTVGTAPIQECLYAMRLAPSFTSRRPSSPLLNRFVPFLYKHFWVYDVTTVPPLSAKLAHYPYSSTCTAIFAARIVGRALRDA